MPKEKGSTFCIACQEEILFAQLFTHNEMAMWCNNPECNRFGLLTVISTPYGKKKSAKKEDKKS